MAIKMGKKLKNAREKNNLTQKRACELAGLSNKSLSDWENDISYPKHDALIILSELYKTPINYFYGVEDSEKTPLPEFAYALYGEVEDLTPEQQEEILRLVKTHKSLLVK